MILNDNTIKKLGIFLISKYQMVRKVNSDSTRFHHVIVTFIRKIIFPPTFCGKIICEKISEKDNFP